MGTMVPSPDLPVSASASGSAHATHAANGTNGAHDAGGANGAARRPRRLRGVWRLILDRLIHRETHLHDSFKELLDAHDDRETPIDPDERLMINNILNVGEITAYDVMVPRADIVSVPADTSLDALVALMVRQPHSRYPVYSKTLDDVVGMVHIKDILAAKVEPQDAFSLHRVMREVLFVAPSMRVLDLLLQMRNARLHMALVVDEYGGIDGLVTIEDLVEEIVGEIEDEHDIDNGPRIEHRPDGSWVADARLSIADAEASVGPILSEEERKEDIDTLGGLVFNLAGRVPVRGELIRHDGSGVEFEVIDADPRHIRRLRLRNLPMATLTGP